MKWLKKLFNPMQYNFDQQIERIGTYKSIYQGQSFQWIKNYPNDNPGIIVSILDIELDQRGEIFCTLNTGQKVLLDAVNSDFQLLQSKEDALSRDAIIALNIDPGVEQDFTPPEELKDLYEKPKSKVQTESVTIKEIPQIERFKADVSMFGMFSLSPTKLKVEVEVPLPNLNLLKIMYSESSNKDLFVKQISEYVFANINDAAIVSSIMNKLNPIKKM